MSNAVTHKLSIQNLLTRFFQAFDDKNWPMLRDCLCDKVFTDYSSFRGEAASTISGDRYVEQRRTALQALEMQHNFLNLRVELDADAKTAKARCNFSRARPTSFCRSIAHSGAIGASDAVTRVRVTNCPRTTPGDNQVWRAS